MPSVDTKHTFVESMISLTMTKPPCGPVISHWNSTQEVLLTAMNTLTCEAVRLCICARSFHKKPFIDVIMPRCRADVDT